MPYMQKATYGGQLTLRRIARVSRALRGKCLFVVMTRDTYWSGSSTELVRRACGLPAHVDIDRLPWIIVLLDVIGNADHSDTNVGLRTSVDTRSFAYPAVSAALDREFGADFMWGGDCDEPIFIRIRGPGWEPVEWDI